MKGFQDTAYLTGYIISNLIGLTILLASFKRPKVARFLLFLLFAWACFTNYYISHKNPEAYLEYANLSIRWYTQFIDGWFSHHITQMVTIISFGQGLIAIGMLLKDRWVRIACWGTIVFLLAIAPLGIGAGFPFSLTVSLAAYLILRRKTLPYFWHIKKPGFIHERY